MRGADRGSGSGAAAPLGRRKRRLRLLTRLLGVAVVLAVVAAAVTYRLRRPETRRPGEELPEITAKLAQGLPREAPTPRFTDVTAEAGLGDFRTFSGARSSQLPEDMGAGAAWGDYDGDGDDDLFLVAGGGNLAAATERARSRLYENLGDGAFREETGFPETRVQGMAAAWGDYDGDGRLDLVVSGYHALALYHNDGGGRFSPGPPLPAPDGYWAGAAWGDFDGDRDLDLYVCGYVRYVEDSGAGRRVSEQYGTAVPYTLNPASFEPESNLLLENLGGGRFEEVAALYGVSNPDGRSLGALWHDFDADGRLDLYVANDISDNALFLNRGDTFEDVGLAAWVADYRGAMGLAAGDWDRDGDDDLFVTHWLAQENALYEARWLGDEDAPAAERRLVFSDIAAPLGLGQIALQSVGWGTEFADFDADGWLDLVVSNGSTLETGEPPRLKPQPLMLLWNRAGKTFHDLAPLSELLAAPRVGRGLALSDYDRDGDLDILLVELDRGALLLRNDMGTGNWLELRLRGGAGQGEGSTATVTVPGAALRRSVSGVSYLSQSSRTLHFGLGAAETIDKVEVAWLGGAVESYEGIEPNAVWELVEGDPSPRRLAGGSDRERVLAFWEAQRAAMNAMKVDSDIPRAVELFREALRLDPSHTDSRYYLANCLVSLGQVEEGLAELQRLRELDPGSHRAHKQWGLLRALTATSRADLAAARGALERSIEINPEETGGQLAVAQISLLTGDREDAARRLEWVSRTNVRSVGALFLRAYLAWSAGDAGGAAELLRAAQTARGPDWKPEGAAAEGDVRDLMHREVSPLSHFWESWSGDDDATAAVFGPLDERLRAASSLR